MKFSSWLTLAKRTLCTQSSIHPISLQLDLPTLAKVRIPYGACHLRPLADPSNMTAQHANDYDIGVAVIDAFTHYVLEFMESINKTSQASMEELVRPISSFFVPSCLSWLNPVQLYWSSEDQLPFWSTNWPIPTTSEWDQNNWLLRWGLPGRDRFIEQWPLSTSWRISIG